MLMFYLRIALFSQKLFSFRPDHQLVDCTGSIIIISFYSEITLSVFTELMLVLPEWAHTHTNMSHDSTNTAVLCVSFNINPTLN